MSGCHARAARRRHGRWRRRRRALPLVLLLLVVLAAPALAEEPAGAPATTVAGPGVDPAVAAELAARPRIGLVLSGGGARGAAHVGVIQALEELHVPIDAIAGTSMGALVGGLYAAGMDGKELETALTGVDWNDALSDTTARDLLSFRRKQDDLALAVRMRLGLEGWKMELPLGLVQGQKLEVLLRSFTLPVATVKDFDHLRVPYRAVATDLETVQPVVLSRGDLVRAMRASMSVPGVFAPVALDGRLLIDGGIVDNLPVEVARQLGVDVLIAVDISTPLSPLADINSPVAVTGQANTGMTQRITALSRQRLGERDLLITPDLTGFSAADFIAAPQIIPRGHTAAMAVADQLRRYALSPGAWAAYQRRQPPEPPPPVVHEVRVVQDTQLSTRYLRRQLTIRSGEPLDLGKLDHDLRVLYGLDLFERVGYELFDAGPGQVDLELQAKQRSWGRDYLRLGISLESDLDTHSSFDVAARMNRFALNSAGAEWRTDLQVGTHNLLRTEFYQPLGFGRALFVAATAGVERGTVWLADTALGEYRLDGGQVGADVGSALGSWGEVRLGVSQLRATATPRNDSSGLPDRRIDDGGLSLRMGADTTDDAAFPRRGTLARGELFYSLASLGAEQDGGRGTLRFDQGATFGRNTVIAGGELSGYADEHARGIPFALGGFGRLSAYGEERIVGRYLGLAHLFYYRQVARPSLVAVKMPVYVGATLEYGQVWQTRKAIGEDMQLHGALFLGVDSPAGPIYVAYGAGPDGRRAWQFLLGRPF